VCVCEREREREKEEVCVCEERAGYDVGGLARKETESKRGKRGTY